MSSPDRSGVSIVLPVFNRTSLARRAIRSVAEQTRADWDLIVVDDGSGEETAAFLKGLTDPRMQVVRIAHTGSPAKARNAGLERARAPHVAFLDSDDAWCAHKLATQLMAMAASPAHRWSYTAYALVDETGRTMPLRVGPAEPPRTGDILFDLLASRSWVHISGLVLETALARELGGFDEDDAILFREDADFAFRLAERGPALGVAEVCHYVGEHPNRSTTGRTDLNDRSAAVYAKAGARTRDPAVRRLCRQAQWRHVAAAARADAARGHPVGAAARLLKLLVRGVGRA